MAVTGIDWGGARVSGETLTVALVAPPGRGLGERLRGALAMLDRGGGDPGSQSIELRHTTLPVRGVREERLRARLDAALVEASGDLGAGAADAGRERGEQRERTCG